MVPKDGIPLASDLVTSIALNFSIRLSEGEFQFSLSRLYLANCADWTDRISARESSGVNAEL